MNLPKQHELPVASNTAALVTTVVSGRADDWFFVQDLSVKRVRRAVGCLVEPQVGDLILLCDAGHSDTSYILNVLAREESNVSTVCLPGGVTLSTHGSQLTVAADDINLQGRDSVGMTTARLDVNAVAATARILHMQSWSDTIETTATRILTVTQTFTQQVGRMITRVRESWRKVEGLDETQAARIRVYVEGSHQLDAEHVTVNAEGFVRVDGKSINIG
ncbi:DUF3540 domain-containing protein [Orrella daihaiensis]|uniref:DUF3540 domain-containing protein n=1 Tax=Orrella daihaiensis TaxID=2782176 RepID=A0ABY4AIE6_9BURK|nr:DUF3540 domain-containing protein [Orrella daihaiensis]UOD50068.1 DUF3540 domain-containing protein [Orrella daihaiensis]